MERFILPKNGRQYIPKKWKTRYFQKMGKLDVPKKWEDRCFQKMEGRIDLIRWSPAKVQGSHAHAGSCRDHAEASPCLAMMALPMLAAALNKKVCGSIPTLKEKGRGTRNCTETTPGIYY